MSSVLAHTSRGRCAARSMKRVAARTLEGHEFQRRCIERTCNMFFSRIRGRHVRICFVAVGVAGCVLWQLCW